MNLSKIIIYASYFIFHVVKHIILCFQTPPTLRRSGQGYGTLPSSLPVSPSSREQTPVGSPSSASSGGRTYAPAPQSSGRKNRVLSSFGKGFLKFRSGKWSSSAPNLGDWLFWYLACTCALTEPRSEVANCISAWCTQGMRQTMQESRGVAGIISDDCTQTNQHLM